MHSIFTALFYYTMLTFKRIALLFTAVILFCCSQLNAATYYASPTGTGVGTLADPCSFTSGLSKLTAAGDTLYLRGGIYNQSAKISINKSGTATARVAIMAYLNEKPILDFSTEPYSSSNPGVSLSSTSLYLHIKGLVIRYAGDNGMINNGSNHVIENCEFYGNCDTGLQHKGGGNNLILNCDSHDNFDYESGGIGTPNYGGNADGFADKQYTATDPNTYDGCRAWNNSDDGWDFFQKIGNTIIKNSICYHNGPFTFDMTNHPRYAIDQAWFNQFTNLAAYPNYGNGNGFKLGGDFTAHNVEVIRCLAVCNRVRGFDQNNNYGKMTILNTSSYKNGYNYGFGNNNGGTLIIKNCVSLNSINSNAYTVQTVTNINNSWNMPAITVNSADFVSLDTNQILTSRNLDGTYTTPFMNLVSGSDLIDAGVFNVIPYAGNNPDLGYYELGVIDQFPPVVTSQNISQTIVLGSPIVNMTFVWSGGATGLDTTNLPNGIIANFDIANKTLTLQGTPTALGNYTFTVTSIGGAGTPVVITCNIYVSSASAKRIAYFTTLPMTAPDMVVYNKLNANPDFFIVPVDATATNTDYSGFAAVVMSPVPGSTSAGFAPLEAVNKPKLLLKPFTLRSTVWAWINTNSAINTTQTTVTISNQNHTIFSGLNFTGTNNDELQLLSSVNTNGVTGITNTTWVASPAVSVLGNALGTTTTNSIVEVPVGTNMNGTVTTQRFVMIGLSEFSLANATANATQLIENTVYYILGLGVPLPVKFSSVNITDIKGSAKVVWNVDKEINIKEYEIERSANASDFITIATIKATGNNDYSWTDKAVLAGKSFYRIIAREKDGKSISSQVLSFYSSNKKPSIIVSPNPVEGKKINLSLTNIEKGKIIVELFDIKGVSILTTNIENSSNNCSKSITIPDYCVNGFYTLRVRLANGETLSTAVLVK